jgi:hypothetical protein
MDWLTADVTTVDIGGFLQYGAVGLIAALGVTFFFLAYKGERERADRNESKYDQVVEKVIPLLQDTGIAARENMSLLKEVQDKVMPILTELERQNRDKGR